MNARQLDPIAEAAIDWLVRLDSGNASVADRAAFARWLHADPRHDQAWQVLTGLLDAPVATIREAEALLPGQRQAAHRALTMPARRKALRSAAALLLLGLGAYALNRQQPLVGLMADLRTGTGERRQVQLADGSTLILNARTAVDVAFSARTRLLHLRQGQILVQAAEDRERPLIVRSKHGEARALGTRFAVQLNEADSQLAVLEHRVELTAADGSRQIFVAGRAARYDAGGILPLDEPAAPLAAWSEGLLDVRDQPLAEVIAALRPYQRGYLRVSPQASRLRIFGVFPLDDMDATLHALAETQPIVVRRYGALLTLVEHRDEVA
ncbi:FecR domain-containing protein [Azovibrio restrictus]|uniref:FecR domain-containing protein n=1 Tax=Azovibrio restrictus TaxID=146938 RepID=UPI0026EC9043|nr:FecR family protein [Azovibrio restrictus]MDD3483187.1 FecR family protein [Azovibrio restrictus]